ncbi:MAG: sodium-independent anion transporter [Caulobacteraceae bacterium]
MSSALSEDGKTRIYHVTGHIFFASAGAFSEAIDLLEPVERMVIDVTQAHFWDISAVGALDKVVLKGRRRRIAMDVVGLNDASSTMVDRFGVHDKSDAPQVTPTH